MSLEGKVGVVTGSAKGIGYGIAEALLQKGAKVCVSDIDEEVGEETVTKFNEKYGKGKAIFVKCDVTSEKDLENLFEKVKSELGVPYVFCNNAGIFNEENWDLMIQTNLIAVIRASYMAMECMAKDKGGNGGVIINVASLAGILCSPKGPVYNAAKHGVVALTRSMALAKDITEIKGLKWVTLCPSFVDTPLVQRALESIPEENKSITMDIIEKNEGMLSIAEIGAAAMRLLDDDVENGSALIAGKVRGQYFHTFSDFVLKS